MYMCCRRNTLNGIAYKDDPTILGWEIINEPRCRLNDSGVIAAPSSCVEGMQTFINEAAAHIKSVDRNHLVSKSPHQLLLLSVYIVEPQSETMPSVSRLQSAISQQTAVCLCTDRPSAG